MSTQIVNPENQNAQNAETAKLLKRQIGRFDLETMEDVTLFKVAPFQPVKTATEAVERLGGSAEKFLSIINEGLEAEAGRALMSDTSVPFQVEDEEGKLQPFTGTPADPAVVNPLILNLAKMFGYPSGEKGEEARGKKAAAKAKAIELVRNTPAIRDGLKTAAGKTAAVVVEPAPVA